MSDKPKVCYRVFLLYNVSGHLIRHTPHICTKLFHRRGKQWHVDKGMVLGGGGGYTIDVW